MSCCCLWKIASHILSFFRIMRRTRRCYVKLLKILVALLRQRDTCAWYPLKILTALLQQRNTCALSLLEAREGPNTQDQAERLVAETGHHLEDTPNTQWAFPTALEDIRCGTPPARRQQCVQSARAVTVEILRLTEDTATVALETARRCSHWRASWASTSDLITLSLRTPCRSPC